MPASKVAISLPPELLRVVDLECRARGMNRSEFLRFAIEDLFRRNAERADDKAYEEAYSRVPEDTESTAAYLAITTAAVDSLPWDE